MKLVVKLKMAIVAETKTKNGPETTLQKLGPYLIEFPLSEVRAFDDKDIEYIIKTVPEYKDFVKDMERYVNELEGTKSELLSKLKARYKRFIDVEPVNLKIKANIKLKHYIEYEEVLITDPSVPYVTNISEYDYMYNNILVE